MKNSTKNKKLIIMIFILIAISIFLFQQNNSIVTSQYTLKFNNLPNDFNGFKILHISDLHSKSFGENQKKLVYRVKETNPDIIVVTGDSVDSKKYNEGVCTDLFSQITKIAPVYYVTGNHEAWSNKFNSFEQKLKDIGVLVLRNDRKYINVKESKIVIGGIDDPAFGNMNDSLYMLDEIMKVNKDNFSILLSHRPELIKTYSELNVDLVFSGHAHGGQVRLPFIGGLISPNQGWFPEYTSGVYMENDTTMVVSRGLGNSIIPQRIFNRPEIVLVTLGSIFTNTTENTNEFNNNSSQSKLSDSFLEEINNASTFNDLYNLYYPEIDGAYAEGFAYQLCVIFMETEIEVFINELSKIESSNIDNIIFLLTTQLVYAEDIEIYEKKLVNMKNSNSLSNSEKQIINQILSSINHYKELF